jgi:hypothetical protein
MAPKGVYHPCPAGQAIMLPGHFDTPVVLEEARSLGAGFASAFVCRMGVLRKWLCRPTMSPP